MPALLAAAPRAVGSVLQRGFPGPAGVVPIRIYRPATDPRIRRRALDAIALREALAIT